MMMSNKVLNELVKNLKGKKLSESAILNELHNMRI